MYWCLNILLHVSAFQNAIISPIWTCWDGVQCREKQRMGAVYCDKRLTSSVTILSTNTLNEWCICWSFSHRKKMHGPNCKNSSYVYIQTGIYANYRRATSTYNVNANRKGMLRYVAWSNIFTFGSTNNADIGEYLYMWIHTITNIFDLSV
jgi:hypothetical protein